MPTYAKRCAVLILTVTAWGAAACTGGGGNTGQTTTRATPEQVSRAESILAELEPNSAGDEHRLALADQAEKLTATCMADNRFRYLPKDPHALVDVATDTDFSSVDYARRYGFGVTASPMFAATSDPNSGYVDSLPQAKRESYEAQLGRCADAAAGEAGRRSGEAEAERRFSRTDLLVRSDPRYRAAEQAWARCAAAKGYLSPTRLDLINSFRAERDALAQQAQTQLATTSQAADDLNRREREAAVATFACSQELDGVYRDVYKEHRETGRP
jgi:hypothetical protein